MAEADSAAVSLDAGGLWSVPFVVGADLTGDPPPRSIRLDFCGPAETKIDHILWIQQILSMLYEHKITPNLVTILY